MKKSHRVVVFIVFILFLSSLIFPQGKSSIQFAGGIVYSISSNSGLSGALQFNYNINNRFNYFISVDYTAWDKRNFSYLDDGGRDKMKFEKYTGVCSLATLRNSDWKNFSNVILYAAVAGTSTIKNKQWWTSTVATDITDFK
jgi:hypothetical protein